MDFQSSIRDDGVNLIRCADTIVLIICRGEFDLSSCYSIARVSNVIRNLVTYSD